MPRRVLYVLFGGLIGAAGREGLALALPTTSGIPWAVLIVNLTGALLLGVVVTVIGRRASGSAAGHDLRLFLGTGVLGGFTTYSSLATGTALLWAADAVLAAIYAIGSVVAGLCAAGLGIACAAALVPARGDAT